MPPANILCLWAKPRWRSILREEEFGAIKTLKGLITRILQLPSMKWMVTKPPTTKGGKINHSWAFMFSLLWEQTPTAFMACCSHAKSWWNAEFWVGDRSRPCKHISLELPSPTFIVGLSTRAGERSNCDSTCFSGCEFFFAIGLYNRNDSHLDMSDL